LQTDLASVVGIGFEENYLPNRERIAGQSPYCAESLPRYGILKVFLTQ